MTAVNIHLQTRLKDLLHSPTEVKAFEFLMFVHQNVNRLPRGGLENKVRVAIDDNLSGEQLQKACMALRDAMANNGQCEDACHTISVVESVMHKQAKHRKAQARKARGPF